MTTRTDESNAHTRLRDKALAELQAGTTPASTPWSMGIDALRLLHRLSGNPDTADDALKLLHELQVHQVEIDLQNEELVARERALVNELSCYRDLFEYAPTSCLLVDHEGMIAMGNCAAVEQFGIAQDDLPGRRLDSLVAAQHRKPLLDLLLAADRDGTGASLVVLTAGATLAPERLLFMASGTTIQGKVLFACCKLPDEQYPAS